MGGKVGYSIAIVFAIFFEITDWLDGWLARRMNQTSSLGKLLDPLADTLTRFTIFLTFLSVHLIPLWMVICLFFRDMIVAYVRVAAAANNYIMSARSSGKLKAVVQGIGIFVVLFVMLLSEFEGLNIRQSDIAWWTMLLVTLVTMYSLVDYIWGLMKISRASRERQQGK